MKKIGLFFGSDTGNTEDVATKIVEWVGSDIIDLFDMAEATLDNFEDYELMILGTSTWYDGELQGDWEDFLPSLNDVDFSGKTVAIFGLGDQYVYPEFFCDGIGIIYDKIIDRGATVVGAVSLKNYDFDESVAERDGMFVGLPLDEDNEPELTDIRVKGWLEQIKDIFCFEMS